MTSVRLAARHPACWLLLVALVLAPWQGLVHGVLHAHGPAGWQSAAPPDDPRAAVGLAHTPDHPDHPRKAAETGLLDLFADHDDEATCRLIDQTSPPGAASLTGAIAADVLPAVWMRPAPRIVRCGRTPTRVRARSPPANP